MPQPVFMPTVLYNIRKRIKKKDKPLTAKLKLGLFKINISYQIHTDSTKRVKLQNWFKKNIYKFAPHKNYKKLKIYSYKYTFNLNKTELTNNKKLVHKLTIML